MEGKITVAKARPLLEVDSLQTFFKINNGVGNKGAQYLKAVNNVSFEIARGETFGLVGESGCGKTTVGRTILRLYEPTGGKVIYNGQNISSMDEKTYAPYRRKMQMIFQDPYTSLDPRQPVSDIVGYPLMLHKMVNSPKEKLDRVRELIHMVGLKDDHINRYPHEFSGGQRQRIGIARALALNPEFIVCDEPISALDVSIQAHIINILEDFQHKFNLTYLFISHDLSMIRHISHRVGVMYLGRLVEVAEVNALFNNMRHPYTLSLMSAAPIADPQLARSSHRIILEGDVPSPLNPPSGCPFRTRCSRATDVCSDSMPDMEMVSSGHFVACHNKL